MIKIMNLPQCGHHDGFDGVEAVFSFIENKRSRAFKHFFGHFRGTQTKLFRNFAANLCLRVVISRQAMEKTGVRISGLLHRFRFTW